MPKMQNRVQETTTTGGTGTITLAGAVTGYITFAAGFTTGDVLFYTLDNGIGEWEIGIGTLVTTGTLSRTTVIASSNSGALVNFSSGTKRVFCSAPTRSLVPDQDSKSGYVLTTDGTNPSWTQTLNSVNIGNTTAGTGAFTTLSASSTVSGTGFSNYLASPPAIGGTAPAAGAFTNLTVSGSFTAGGSTGTSGQVLKSTGTGIEWGAAASTGVTSVSGTGTVSGITLSGTVTSTGNLTLGGSLDLSSPPAIGGTAPAAGSFTTLTTSSTVTINGGTANGVGYLNASKVLTTGSALTFDGTNLSTTGTATATKLVPTGNVTAGNGMYLPATNTLAWSTNGTERARITSTGVFQISSSGSRLEFTGSSGDKRIAQADAIVVGGAATDFAIQAENNLLFATGGTTERMRLDSSGNLGLGVTPSAWNTSFRALQVGSRSSFYQDSSAAAVVGNNAYNDTGGTNRYLATAAASLYLQNAGSHAWLTAASGTAGNTISFTQAMTLTAAGDLGIGTASPDAKLEVAVGDNGAINIEQTGANQTGYLNWRDTDGALSGRVSYDHGTDAMRFATTNTERARIKSGGQFRFVPLGSDPSGAEAGDVYYNSNLNKLYCYNGSTWNALF